MAERIRTLWERIKADIQRNPGLWIGVGISAVILVIAYLAYRQSHGQGVVPANGYGFPDYGTSSGGSDASGLSYPGYAPVQPASPSVPVSPITSPITNPSSPATAYPAFPAFTLSGPYGPPSPLAPAARVLGQISEYVGSLGVFHASPTSAGNIQNPTAAQTEQHRSAAPIVTATSAPIQNPTAAQDIAHRGSLPTAPTSYRVPTIIPTTIRPVAVTTRGRVA